MISEIKFCNVYNTFWNLFFRITFLEYILERTFWNETKLDGKFDHFIYLMGCKKNFVWVREETLLLVYILNQLPFDLG